MALVTGASAGIGAAICQVLAKHGMKVVGCARRIEKIEELAKAQPGIIPYKVYREIPQLNWIYRDQVKYFC